MTTIAVHFRHSSCLVSRIIDALEANGFRASSGRRLGPDCSEIVGYDGVNAVALEADLGNMSGVHAVVSGPDAHLLSSRADFNPDYVGRNRS